MKKKSAGVHIHIHTTKDSKTKDASYTGQYNALVSALKADYKKTGDASGFDACIDGLQSEYNRLP